MMASVFDVAMDRLGDRVVELFGTQRLKKPIKPNDSSRTTNTTNLKSNRLPPQRRIEEPGALFNFRRNVIAALWDRGMELADRKGPHRWKKEVPLDSESTSSNRNLTNQHHKSDGKRNPRQSYERRTILLTMIKNHQTCLSQETFSTRESYEDGSGSRRKRRKVAERRSVSLSFEFPGRKNWEHWAYGWFFPRLAFEPNRAALCFSLAGSLAGLARLTATDSFYGAPLRSTLFEA
ncbi:hypothetical protein KM043_001026 [Ampulex compressa]|nr:hypothetical protein KM043_001026 [Ampulex compressa]